MKEQFNELLEWEILPKAIEERNRVFIEGAEDEWKIWDNRVRVIYWLQEELRKVETKA